MYKKMPHSKGSPNKLTAVVKDKLQEVMDDVLSTLDRQTTFMIEFCKIGRII